MVKLRMHFTKTGRARFISHLDLMQVLRRAMLRAGLPLRYSEGYNPHAVMSVALPLPVGVGGLCEIMDFSLTHPVALEALPRAITAVLPEGITVLDVTAEARPVREIAKARYDIVFQGAAEQGAALRAVFDGRPLMVEKRTKKGTGIIDIAPVVAVERIFVRSAGDGDAPDGLYLQIVLPTENPSLAPEHVLAAVRGEWPACAAYPAQAVRTATLGADGVAF